MAPGVGPGEHRHPYGDVRECGMASEPDWLHGVRRWYERRSSWSGQAPGAGHAFEEAPDGGMEVGYEAADPALQAPHGFDIEAMAARGAHLR